eukprot:TRINITY_DN1464_c0_g1_i2.p1 TRINITY_DN1464_c0_g1~~TRINITY_DN1464_c0_g1_i2.p1  ORF type:complete len:305 (-),score=61.87 TRINITY_DN1464_c0_g1_i2:25-939(-)
MMQSTFRQVQLAEQSQAALLTQPPASVAVQHANEPIAEFMHTVALTEEKRDEKAQLSTSAASFKSSASDFVNVMSSPKRGSLGDDEMVGDTVSADPFLSTIPRGTSTPCSAPVSLVSAAPALGVAWALVGLEAGHGAGEYGESTDKQVVAHQIAEQILQRLSGYCRQHPVVLDSFNISRAIIEKAGQRFVVLIRLEAHVMKLMLFTAVHQHHQHEIEAKFRELLSAGEVELSSYHTSVIHLEQMPAVATTIDLATIGGAHQRVDDALESMVAQLQQIGHDLSVTSSCTFPSDIRLSHQGLLNTT